MIRSSFIFLPGVGERTERELWRRGVTGWDAYRGTANDLLPRRVARMRDSHERHLALAERCLDEGRLAPFARWLPSTDIWRLLPEAGDRTLYLDIETTGLSYPEGQTTVVGAHMPAEGTRLLVRGRDLDGDVVRDVLARASMLVTFNGRGFDAPFLEREFGVRTQDVPHLDLMLAFRRLGIRGGLKRIEARFGLSRADEVQGLGGWEAVRLWRQHERGDPRALETLLAYNEADVLNMVPLAQLAYSMLRGATLGAATGSSGDPPAVPLQARFP